MIRRKPPFPTNQHSLLRWDEKAGPLNGMLLSSQLETHSKCKKETGHEEE
jgi:hypothetical protein